MEPTQLAQLIDRHTGPLTLYAAQWTAAAEDAVQDALMQLLKCETAPVAVIPWLYRATRYRALSLRRADSRRQRREAVATCLRQANSVGIDAAELTECLDELADDIRETLVAHLWGGLTFVEVAELTGTSVGTAHRRYQQGLATLRARLQVSETQRN